MNCPRCQTALTKQMVKEVNSNIELDQCNTCEGLWFDQGELTTFEKVIEPTLWEVRKISKEQDQLIGLHCPKCTDHPLMQKVEHPRDNKVIMDCCTSCKGIWLDKGELEAIQKESWFSLIGRLFS